MIYQRKWSLCPNHHHHRRFSFFFWFSFFFHGKYILWMNKGWHESSDVDWYDSSHHHVWLHAGCHHQRKRGRGRVRCRVECQQLERKSGIHWVNDLLRRLTSERVFNLCCFIASFDVDPGKRHTFWSLVIGGYFTWAAIYGVNQSQVQRYLTVATIKQARK